MPGLVDQALPFMRTGLLINGTNPQEKVDYKDLKNNADTMSPGMAGVKP